MTTTFSKPVQNLTFSLLDVDSAKQGNTLEYEDLVVINTPGWTGVKHTNVMGSGTTAAPYRALTTNSPVDGTSPDSNIDLELGGLISAISFVYKQDGTVQGDPFIGIPNVSFQYCL